MGGTSALGSRRSKRGAGSTDVFENLSNEDYKKARKLMIKCVLATDMSQHFLELNKYKGRTSAPDFNPQTTDKMLNITVAFHMADISNGVKPWEVCRKWTDLLFVEFFAQGD